MQKNKIMAMNADKFRTLSKEGETSKIEYKSCTEEVSESLYETVCSFLNHAGGHILVGVSDDGTIVGVNPAKGESLKDNIITCINNAELFLPCPYFTPQIMNIDGRVVLQLEIPCGEYVYRYKGRYWDRNGSADIDITDQPELLLSLFERKNPHLFEERIVNGLTMGHLDHGTFQYCRNAIAAKKAYHPWVQMTDEQILLNTHLAKKNDDGKLQIKYAALILFGKDDSIAEMIPRYRFEALFHMCSFKQYNDMKQFPNRYDDRRTIRQNLVQVYRQLAEFVERYLPDKFYLPDSSNKREDLRWNLFREIVGNLCVHADFNSGYACFFHVFKDRVVTKNPTRLLPEVPEGEMKIEHLNNYTKNPLLVRVFHELSWVEDLGSGVRNILRYAPLYYPNYKIEINNGTQFIFSITYMDEIVHENGKAVGNSPQNVGEMSETHAENVRESKKMSETSPQNVLGPDLNEEDLSIIFAKETGKAKGKRSRRRQGIISLIVSNPDVSICTMADKLGVNEKTIRRDLEEMRNQGVIRREGGDFGGHWEICKKK